MTLLHVKQTRGSPPSESGPSDRWVSFYSQHCLGFYRLLCDLQQTVIALILCGVAARSRLFEVEPLRKQAAIKKKKQQPNNLFLNWCKKKISFVLRVLPSGSSRRDTPMTVRKTGYFTLAHGRFPTSPIYVQRSTIRVNTVLTWPRRGCNNKR